MKVTVHVGTLVAMNQEGIRQPHILPNPQFPLVFHGVIGEDQREADSPSYFNAAEIDVVL